MGKKMTRIFCDKCYKVLNFYPNRNTRGKVVNYTSKCPHKISVSYVKKNKIVVKWFLADGRELKPVKPVERRWEIVEKK